MKLSIKAGATSVSVNVFIQDSSSTTGAGKTGLAYNTSGLTAYYSFAGANATSTAITLATLAAVNSAYSSGGFKEIDATNMPGWYRLDIPNAALASGNGRSVAIHLQGATNMAPTPIEIELTGWDNQDAVHGGLSCLPNTACTSNASLITSGSGTDQLTVSGGVASADAKKINAVSTSSVTNVNAVIGTGVAVQQDGSGYAKVSNGTGTGQISLVSGAVAIQSGSSVTVNGLTDAGAQLLAQLTLRYKNIWYVRSDGSDSNTGKQPTSGGAFLTLSAAMTAASSGDVIYLLPGTIAQGNTQVVGKSGVDVIGSGRSATTLTTTLGNSSGTTNACINPGSNSLWQGFTLQGTAASGNFQFLFGAQTADNAFTNVVLRDVRMIGDSDCLYLAKDGLSIICYGCVFESKWDTVYAYSTPGSVWTAKFYDCDFVILGPSTISSGTAFTHGMAWAGGTLYAERCRFYVTNSGGSLTETVGVKMENAGLTGTYGWINDCTFYTSGGSGGVYDIQQTSGPLYVSDSAYSRSKINGTITVVNAADVASINGVLATNVTAIGAYLGNANAALAVDGSGRIDQGKVLGNPITTTSPGYMDVNVQLWKGSAAPAMTGDAYARIGAAGVGLTNLGDARLANLDAAISSRSTYAGGAADANAAAIKAKTDLIATNSADSPNAVTAQTNAATAVTQTTAAAIAAAVWNAAKASYQVAGSFGAWVGGLVTAVISPLYATLAGGEASKGALVGYESAIFGPVVWTAPGDLTGHTLKLVVFDPNRTNAILFELATGGQGIAISGQTVTFTGQTPLGASSAGDYLFDVWDVTNSAAPTVLLTGSFTIKVAKAP